MRHQELVRALATPAGRMVGTPGHRAAQQLLLRRLRELQLAPYGDRIAMPYRVDGVDFCNLVAVAPGTDPTLDPVVLAAHYDTCGRLPGADDNAAAVAIVLDVAQRLRAQPARRPVVIALFDAEEPPFYLSASMGSMHWYHHQRTQPVHAAVVLDLVGHAVPVAGIEDLLFVAGIESDRGLLGAEQLAAPGVRVHPVLHKYIGDMSDHAVFRQHGRPFLFLSCGRWQHYHQPTDTPDKLDYDKMIAIASTTEAIVRHTCSAELLGPFMGADTLGLELSAIRRHFGPWIGTPARLFGRKGVDAFVAMAMASLGV